VSKIVTRWRIRAVRQGFIQVINEATLVPAHFLQELCDESEISAGQGSPAVEIHKAGNFGSFQRITGTEHDAEWKRIGKPMPLRKAL
jgi:hypothetical protein